MNRIESRFRQFRREGESCLIPFITAGHPNLKTSFDLVLEFEERGAGMVELGVPFSDPIADGIIIQQSSERSLKHGTSLKDVLDLVKDLRLRTSIPLILLSYYNPVYKYGVDRFVKDAVSAGVDGIIIPDLPPEEAGMLKRIAGERLATIFLVAPTSTIQRIRVITQVCTGFIYYVSLTGVTGMRERLSKDIAAHIEEIRRISNLPIGVGFGISNPEQAAEVASFADGVIVGSAIVDLILKNESNPDLVQKVGEFVGSLIKGIQKAERRVDCGQGL